MLALPSCLPDVFGGARAFSGGGDRSMEFCKSRPFDEAVTISVREVDLWSAEARREVVLTDEGPSNRSSTALALLSGLFGLSGNTRNFSEGGEAMMGL